MPIELPDAECIGDPASEQSAVESVDGRFHGPRGSDSNSFELVFSEPGGGVCSIWRVASRHSSMSSRRHSGWRAVFLLAAGWNRAREAQRSF